MTIIDYIIFGIGFILLLAWLVIYFLTKKEASYFAELDEKEFPLKDIYFWGFGLLELLHYEYKSPSVRKLRKQLEILYDERYTDYYIRVVYAQKISISSIMLVLSVPLYGITEELVGLFIGLMFTGVFYYYFGTACEKKLLSRSDEMLSEFSNVVSKLALLINAGMILREAWADVAYTGNSVLYQEMQKTVEDMENGMSESDALFAFGMRCMIPEIKKFTSTLIQGIQKGNSNLAVMIQEQSKEVWNLKRQNVRRQGEKAASNLLIPIFLMFIGILIMVIVPVFTNLGM